MTVPIQVERCIYWIDEDALRGYNAGVRAFRRHARLRHHGRWLSCWHHREWRFRDRYH